MITLGIRTTGFRLSLAGFLIVCIVTQISCVSTSKAIYFADQGDTVMQSSIQAQETIIQSSDLLSISVSSVDPQATEAFNLLNNSGAVTVTSNGNITQSSGYLVNSEGSIKFPFLGKVKAAGLTEIQLSDTITREIVNRKLLIDPIVSIRHLNFKVTVLGEVGRPSVISVPNGRISILEAIGLAGDLTIYGKRSNVLLIREEKGVKITKRLNLNSNELLHSPYYYLKSNDVIYVEPNKAKVASSSRVNQLLPVVFGGLSLVVVVIDRLTR